MNSCESTVQPLPATGATTTPSVEATSTRGIRRRTSQCSPRYVDRIQAGEILATKLKPTFQNRPNVVILAISKAGLVVATTVAEALNLPAGVFYVQQITVPTVPHLSMGVVTSAQQCILNHDILAGLDLSSDVLDQAVTTARVCLHQAHAELAPRFFQALDAVCQTPAVVEDVLLMDDGVASGDDMRAAIAALKQMNPALKITVATPVGIADTMKHIAHRVESTITAFVPAVAYQVPQWYESQSFLSPNELAVLTLA
ncbi:hypothetical protein IWQ61_007197 [Dispira simplex]|nr:hypothetical protein IWQ61_007197 [Dispira simplex]